jgi:hypothetical protein
MADKESSAFVSVEQLLKDQKSLEEKEKVEAEERRPGPVRPPPNTNTNTSTPSSCNSWDPLCDKNVTGR